jgi:hypothetical protein
MTNDERCPSWRALATRGAKRLDCRRCLRAPQGSYYEVSGCKFAYCAHRQLLSIDIYGGGRYLRPETSPAKFAELVYLIASSIMADHNRRRSGDGRNA